MPDKLSVLALREVGSIPNVPDRSVEIILDKYGPAIAKEARRRERSDLLTSAGRQTIEEMSQLDTLRTERDARPTAGQMSEHGRHRFHQGVGAGILAGAAITVAIGAALVPMLTQSTVSGVAVGSQIQRQSDNVRLLEKLDAP